MRQFFNNLASISWWLSVVAVGVALNVLSVYLTRRLDNRLSRASSWWRDRSAKKQAERVARAATLRESFEEQVIAGFDEIRDRMDAVYSVVIAAVFTGFALLLSRHPYTSYEGVKKWMALFMQGAAAGLMFMYLTRTVSLLRSARLTSDLLAEARKPEVQAEQPK